jgi:predicted HTH transcriptional regulator
LENTELFADCELRLATIEFEIIHQALATMHLLEQRGGGFARMRDRMLNHGLDTPLCAQQDGYFVITFHSPKGDDERLKLPEGASGIITSAVEAQFGGRLQCLGGLGL